MSEKLIDETLIDGENVGETAPKKKRAGRKKSSPDVISYEEAQQKLARVFNGVCTLLKIDKRYKESEFVEEAKDLSRMAQKYDIINTVLTFLDPIFLLLGLIGKGSEIAAQSKERKVKMQQEKPKEETPSNVLNYDQHRQYAGGVETGRTT